MPKPDYTSLKFPPPPAHRPYVIANMVASVDGRSIVDGTEQGLGSKDDQRLMRELRVHADVILTGAGTLRATGASPRLGDPLLEQLRIDRGKPRFATSAVMSRSGELPLDRIFFTARDFEAIVYLSEATTEERARAIAATGRPVVRVPYGAEVEAMLHHMRDRLGAQLVLCEGGAALNGAMLAAGAIDELFLTLGPVLAGGAASSPIIAGSGLAARATLRPLRLLHAIPNADTGEVYLRYACL